MDLLITNQLKVAENWKDKLLGLILKSNPRYMLFKTRLGIHTFGLNAPIDVVVLDKAGRVVKEKMSLNPYHFFFWNPKFNKVLELPEGTITKFKISKGDLLEVS